MHVTCPTCNDSFPLAAGFLEGDGKRFGLQLAGMEPALGRATVEYLALFAPAKQRLRLAKAVKLVAALDALVRAGTVCRDERGGVRRPATGAHWVAGIEQMLEQRARLTLPLQNHNYLRSIVYGIADQADQQVERQREQDARSGRPRAGGASVGVSPPQPPGDPLKRDLRYAEQMLSYGQIDQEECDRQRAAAYAKHRPQT